MYRNQKFGVFLAGSTHFSVVADLKRDKPWGSFLMSPQLFRMPKKQRKTKKGKNILQCAARKGTWCLLHALHWVQVCWFTCACTLGYYWKWKACNKTCIPPRKKKVAQSCTTERAFRPIAILATVFRVWFTCVFGKVYGTKNATCCGQKVPDHLQKNSPVEEMWTWPMGNHVKWTVVHLRKTKNTLKNA